MNGHKLNAYFRRLAESPLAAEVPFILARAHLLKAAQLQVGDRFSTRRPPRPRPKSSGQRQVEIH